MEYKARMSIQLMIMLAILWLTIQVIIANMMITTRLDKIIELLPKENDAKKDISNEQ